MQILLANEEFAQQWKNRPWMLQTVNGSVGYMTRTGAFSADFSTCKLRRTFSVKPKWTSTSCVNGTKWNFRNLQKNKTYSFESFQDFAQLVPC
uniref:Uncharacterized protein n=1 Tax=Panagrolaimus sp. JU765 TaxID=591449 RepID=A0AC34RA10_9BILA